MRVVRGVATWVGGWLAAAAVIFAGLAIWTYAQGGAFHRTPICRGPDMNVYAAAFLAAWLALIVVLAYWALGAPNPPLAMVPAHRRRGRLGTDRVHRPRRHAAVDLRVHVGERRSS